MSQKRKKSLMSHQNHLLKWSEQEAIAVDASSATQPSATPISWLFANHFSQPRPFCTLSNRRRLVHAQFSGVWFNLRRLIQSAAAVHCRVVCPRSVCLILIANKRKKHSKTFEGSFYINIGCKSVKRNWLKITEHRKEIAEVKKSLNSLKVNFIRKHERVNRFWSM
jgi:hypothetical protein